MSDTELLDFASPPEFRVRWKVIGQRGKRVLAYSLEPGWGYPTLRDALRAAAEEARRGG